MRAAAGELAERIAAERPDTLTTFWRKDKREGRILVDVARNTYGQTIVAPYAVRALAGAPVAMPVHWEEVADASLRPRQFGLRDIEKRLQEPDPWAEMDGAAAPLPKNLSPT